MTVPAEPTAPVVVRKDAQDRAWRTFLQNIWLDIALLIGPYLMTVVTEARWTKEYWIPVGISVAKTLLLIVISYVMRLRKPPAIPTKNVPVINGEVVANDGPRGI